MKWEALPDSGIKQTRAAGAISRPEPPANAIDPITVLRAEVRVYRALTLIGKDRFELAKRHRYRLRRPPTVSNSL
jgi:hypothetical protein